MNKKLLLVVLLVLAAVIAGAFYYSKHPFFGSQGLDKSFSVDTKPLPSAQLPVGFFADFPQEVGSVVLQNYQSTTKDGRTQSTRIMTTTKTPEQAVKIYADYFTKLNWQNVNLASSEPSSKTVLLRKKDDVVSITAKIDAQTKQNIVAVTLTQSPKNTAKK